MFFQFTAMFEIIYNDAKRNYAALLHNQGNCIPPNVQIFYLWWVNKAVLLEQKQGLLKSQKPKQGLEMVCEWVIEIYILQTTEMHILFFFLIKVREYCQILNQPIQVLRGLSRYPESGRNVAVLKNMFLCMIFERHRVISQVSCSYRPWPQTDYWKRFLKGMTVSKIGSVSSATHHVGSAMASRWGLCQLQWCPIQYGQLSTGNHPDTSN